MYIPYTICTLNELDNSSIKLYAKLYALIQQEIRVLIKHGSNINYSILRTLLNAVTHFLSLFKINIKHNLCI